MPDEALQLEISFLQHRLEVIESWPDSARKRATRHAISVRLLALGAAPSPGRAEKAQGASA